MAVLQRSSKGRSDQPCCVLEHVTSVLPMSFGLGILCLYDAHSNNILCQGTVNVLFITLFNSYQEAIFIHSFILLTNTDHLPWATIFLLICEDGRGKQFQNNTKGASCDILQRSEGEGKPPTWGKDWDASEKRSRMQQSVWSRKKENFQAIGELRKGPVGKEAEHDAFEDSSQ